MIAPTARCRSHALATASARLGPRPGTSVKRSGDRSSTSSASIPKASTMRLAYAGPMPGTMPEPR